MMRMLFKAHDQLTKGSFVLGTLCLVVIVFAYSHETVARYFFSAPTSWSNEVVGYALCIGLFLVLPELTRTRGHIAITFVAEALPDSATRYLQASLNFISGVTCLAVAWFSIEENIRQISNEVMLVTTTPIPKILISVWISYGFLSAGLYFLRAVSSSSLPGQRIGPEDPE